MKQLRCLLLMLLFILPAGIVFAQQKTITGKVTDQSTGEPLSGVSVLADKNKKGVATKQDGAYSITTDGGSTSLIFSYVGYASQVINIGTNSVINVSLLPSVKTGDDIVVIGYGTSRKKDLTGSVASIPMADLEKIPITRADQMIQGRVSGVQVIQTNAEPGGNVSIRIRGTNSINSGNEPLFVIDGFPGAGDLNSINPSDIASIEILKDASATAIYGSRGANGVVLISTKKGKADKHTVTFEMFTGFQKVANPYEMMNAKEFAAYLNDVQNLANIEAPSSARPLPYRQGEIDSMGAGTNWQDELFRTAPSSNYQLGFNGGNSDTKYNLSFNLFEQKGIILNSGFKRGSVRFNFDRNISAKLKLGFTSQFTRSWEDRALVNTSGGTNGGVLLDALRISPIIPVKDAQGQFTFQNGPAPYVDIVGNPIAYAEKSKDKRNNLRGLVNAFFEYQIVNGLKFKVSGGTDFNFGTRDFFRPSDIFLGGITNGSALKFASNRFAWVNENTLTYAKQINKNHTINVLGGFSLQEFKTDDFSAAATNFFTNSLGTNNLSLGANVLTPVSNAQKNSLSSFFARANYSLMEKYLFTFTMRADGSSRFGVGNKWGYFPSGAFAWRMGDENFIKNIKAISDLKLRVSYGITGNQEIGSYQSIARYDDFSYTLGGPVRAVGVAINSIPNPNLSWESTRSFDAGIDLSLFNDRLTFTADYYDKQTNDLLLLVSIPRSTGFQNVLLNAGSVGNKGVEFALNTSNIEKKNFKWTSNFNISFNRNKVLDLNGEFERFVGEASGSIFPGASAGTSVLRVGEPIGSFYGYKFLGIYQNAAEVTASGITGRRPGDPIYEDVNGDKAINATDRTIIGRAQPKFTWGFTNNVSYKKFNLNFFLYGSEGQSVLNLNRYELESGLSTTAKLKSVVNRWTGEGTSNTIPKANSVVRRNTGVTSDIVEDASFVRFKNITLGYDIIDAKQQKKGLFKGVTIYVTAQNLFTITKYSGYDPEVNSFGASNLSLNTDYNAFPVAKSFIAGVRVQF
jgi:TonB-dependent starch-binding outer membrane protein SusC